MSRYFRWFGLPGAFVLTCLMSLLALLLAVFLPGQGRLLCLSAMLLSSMGDIVLMDFRGIQKRLPVPGFALGAVLFMLAHIVYAIAFVALLRDHQLPLLGGGFVFGIALALLTFIFVSWRMFTSVGTINLPLYLLCTIYLVIIGLNLSLICAYGVGMGSWRILCALGAVLFFASDVLIALDKLLGIRLPNHDEVIWWLYPIGQILILSFH